MVEKGDSQEGRRSAENVGMSGYISRLERCLYVLCKGSRRQERARRMFQKLTRNDGCVSQAGQQSGERRLVRRGNSRCHGSAPPSKPRISNIESPTLFVEMRGKPASLIISLAMRAGTSGRLKHICPLPGLSIREEWFAATGPKTKLKVFTLAVPWAAASSACTHSLSHQLQAFK